MLGHALLGLLAGHPMSGYDLTAAFDGSLGFVWPAKHAQIYPELARLAESGYLAQSESGARGRIEYVLTPAGHAELRRWLLETQPSRRPRNEILLRSFFAWSLPPERARDYFLERERNSREMLAQLQTIADSFDVKTPEERAYRVTLEAGLRQTRVMAEWAAWAAQQYEE